MEFFNTLNRSITDPKFYREIAGFSSWQIVWFLLKLMVLIAIISSAAQYYYLFDSKRGIPTKIESVFQGMEIKNGLLDPKSPTPVIPATYKVIPLLDQLSGNQNYFASDNDSMVIIDTAKVRNYVVKVPAIIVSSDRIIFTFNKKSSFELPYKVLLMGSSDFQFTADNVKKYLLKNWFLLCFSLFVTTLFQNMITFFFSIMFLSFAAFVFRVEKVAVFSTFIRAASYAITPMALGSMLIAVSGVKILWGWHILIFISTIVLFRGMVAIGTQTPDKEVQGENKE